MDTPLCRDCRYFEPSDAGGRGLAGYGYCRKADTPDLRARFFPETSDCWLMKNKREARL